MDFLGDWGEILKSELRMFNIPAEDSESPGDLCIKYINFRRRLVEDSPRQILKAKSFKCPSKHIKALHAIEKIIKDGGNLTPYLGKEILIAIESRSASPPTLAPHAHIFRRLKRRDYL